ncbi:uncharacterized protein [Branchiostoma lanceolatum]|uniref:uncharacterized protein n=1 Tax=Branchiostoma lanceolatum TaxID=7740 RepID=UPI0034563E92
MSIESSCTQRKFSSHTSSLFNLRYWCTRRPHKTGGQYWRAMGTKKVINMCPQPCLSKPCRGKSKVKPGSRCTQTGHYSDPNYRCVCETGWEWNQRHHRCDDRNVCDTTHSRCDKAHTERCVESIGMSYSCTCINGWTGKFCTEEVNPCYEHGGNDACHPNGICVPVMRSTIYTCDCNDGWSDEPEDGAQQLADCDKKDDPCDRVACMNGGHCSHSKNGRDVFCTCTDLYVGDRCQHRKPHWGEWDGWGPCSVTCGAQGVRKRLRHCRNPTGLTDLDCSGKKQEEEVCRAAVCKYSGRWTSWGEATPCTEVCGTGIRVKTRHCKYCKDADCVEETQLEAERGSPCDGIATETTPCNTNPCPIPPPIVVPVVPAKPAPQWSAWGAWGACSQTCDPGLRTRSRQKGKDTQDESEECRVMACPKVIPVKCTPWTDWGVCDAHSKMCYRTRDSVSGETCDGHTYQRSGCSGGNCLGEVKAEGHKENLFKALKLQKAKLAEAAAKKKKEELEKRLKQEQKEAEERAEKMKFFTEEKGKYFGTGTTSIKAWNDISFAECARRCLEGHGDYDGTNPVCKSFNYRPANTKESKTARCWLHSENKDTFSGSTAWSKWPHRDYYQRKGTEESAIKSFTEEKGHFFGTWKTSIKSGSYENIGVDECARRCLKGHGDYDGVNPICKSFNYRPGGTAETTKSKCWLHQENKDTFKGSSEWTKWPHRNYYHRKEIPVSTTPKSPVLVTQPTQEQAQEQPAGPNEAKSKPKKRPAFILIGAASRERVPSVAAFCVLVAAALLMTYTLSGSLRLPQ